MLEDEVLPYDLALEADNVKMSGYLCMAIYSSGTLYPEYQTFQWNDFSDCIKAPLWQQAISWFRTEYNIWVNPITEYEGKYHFIVAYENKNDFHTITTEDIEGTTFREARYDAVKCAFRIIKSGLCRHRTEQST